jgi:hypothetical protein
MLWRYLIFHLILTVLTISHSATARNKNVMRYRRNLGTLGYAVTG